MTRSKSPEHSVANSDEANLSEPLSWLRAHGDGFGVVGNDHYGMQWKFSSDAAMFSIAGAGSTLTVSPELVFNGSGTLLVAYGCVSALFVHRSRDRRRKVIQGKREQILEHQSQLREEIGEPVDFISARKKHSEILRWHGADESLPVSTPVSLEKLADWATENTVESIALSTKNLEMSDEEIVSFGETIENKTFLEKHTNLAITDANPVEGKILLLTTDKARELAAVLREHCQTTLRSLIEHTHDERIMALYDEILRGAAQESALLAHMRTEMNRYIEDYMEVSVHQGAGGSRVRARTTRAVLGDKVYSTLQDTQTRSSLPGEIPQRLLDFASTHPATLDELIEKIMTRETSDGRDAKIALYLSLLANKNTETFPAGDSDAASKTQTYLQTIDTLDENVFREKTRVARALGATAVTGMITLTFMTAVNIAGGYFPDQVNTVVARQKSVYDRLDATAQKDFGTSIEILPLKWIPTNSINSASEPFGDVFGDMNTTAYTINNPYHLNTRGYWRDETPNRLHIDTGGVYRSTIDRMWKEIPGIDYTHTVTTSKNLANADLTVNTPYSTNKFLPYPLDGEIEGGVIYDKKNPSNRLPLTAAVGSGGEIMTVSKDKQADNVIRSMENPTLEYGIKYKLNSADTPPQNTVTDVEYGHTELHKMSDDDLHAVAKLLREKLGLSDTATQEQIVQKIKQKYYSFTPLNDAGEVPHTNSSSPKEILEAVSTVLAQLKSENCNTASLLTLLASDASTSGLYMQSGYYNNGDDKLVSGEAHAWLNNKDGEIVDSTPRRRIDTKKDSLSDEALALILSGIAVAGGAIGWRKSRERRKVWEIALHNKSLMKAYNFVEHTLYAQPGMNISKVALQRAGNVSERVNNNLSPDWNVDVSALPFRQKRSVQRLKKLDPTIRALRNE